MLILLTRISARVVKIERVLLTALVSVVTGLILLNVVTRSLNYAIFWIDELAIYSMIWLVMIGASTLIRTRKGISVTLLEGVLGDWYWRKFLVAVDVIILGFTLALVCLSWIWYDPFTLLRTGFDTVEFSAQTFNFIYQEPTTTLTVPKYLIWLVMPVTALSMSLHALVNFWERLSGIAAPAFELD